MVLFGLLMVYSSSFIYAQERTGDGFAFIKKQLFFSRSRVRRAGRRLPDGLSQMVQLGLPGAGACGRALAAVFIPGLGTRALGAQRWLHLGPLNFQPGELAKFAVIFFVAHQLERKKERIHTFAAGVLSHFHLPLPAFLLLLLQPDFGTTVMIMVRDLRADVPGGRSQEISRQRACSCAASSALFFASGAAYRRRTRDDVLGSLARSGRKGLSDPPIALGLHNGRFSGVGLGNGKEKLFFLPEAHNDFIFAVIGEELGFLGIVAVILRILYFIYRGLRIALNCTSSIKIYSGCCWRPGSLSRSGFRASSICPWCMGLVADEGTDASVHQLRRLRDARGSFCCRRASEHRSRPAKGRGSCLIAAAHPVS